jgi:hypothetical protein
VRGLHRIVVVGLSQTAVGPLIAVPADGNGLVAGFPDSSGTVPGLLATGGSAAAPTSRRAPAAAPVVRSRDVTSAGTARSTGKKGSTASVVEAEPGSKGTVASRGVPSPAHGPGSPVDSGRGRTASITSGTTA